MSLIIETFFTLINSAQKKTAISIHLAYRLQNHRLRNRLSAKGHYVWTIPQVKADFYSILGFACPRPTVRFETFPHRFHMEYFVPYKSNLGHVPGAVI